MRSASRRNLVVVARVVIVVGHFVFVVVMMLARSIMVLSAFSIVVCIQSLNSSTLLVTVALVCSASDCCK